MLARSDSVREQNGSDRYFWVTVGIASQNLRRAGLAEVLPADAMLLSGCLPPNGDKAARKLVEMRYS